jgi:hypothetical protein
VKNNYDFLFDENNKDYIFLDWYNTFKRKNYIYLNKNI